MKLSIIIVNYNVKYYLAQCLTSVVRATNGIDSEIIVVDNHSRDGSVEYIEQNFPKVRCISSIHNLGFARANNIAIRQSRGDFVLLLNPDTIVGESTLKESVQFMDEHLDAGGLGVMMLKSDGEKAKESRRGLPTPMVAFYKIIGLCKCFPKHPKFGHYYMSDLPWDSPEQIEVVSGAYCLLRKSALDKTGLLDETFFMYGEDIDLSYRLLKNGYKNWYLPVPILHYKGESTQKSSFRYVHVFYDAMLIFFRKHYGGMSTFLSVPIKFAIYCQAFASLCRMLYSKSTKALGFFRPSGENYANYLFIGEEASIDKCKEIIDSRGLAAKYVMGNSQSMPNGHLDCEELLISDKINYIVYDIGAYSYDEILNIFLRRPIDNVYIGTFDKSSGYIITSEEILTHG